MKFVMAAALLFSVSSCQSVSSWYQVYFTTPGKPNTEIPDALIKLISQAKTSIHIAAFEFNLDPIAEALIAAKQRGIDVKWVTDNEHGLKADGKPGHGQFAKLKQAGIEIKDDNRGALMHNKFVIVDGQVLWTGSTNLTVNGTQKNNNNVLVMRSPEIAAIYEREFQEMWSGKFGKTSPSNVASQKAIVNGTPVTVLFGSEDNVADALIAEIGKAQKSIKFMAFSFTDDGMGKAMMARANQRVKLEGIFETRGSETKYSELPGFFCEGISVRQDGNSRTFHHKVIVLDKKTVITGSFNFSNNANKSNDENVVIVENPQIASLYLQEFDRRWQEGKPPRESKISCR
ncbi:MAG: hypothetical protein GDA56_12870 [Hormoscilla sp. GM7CHS1pb]|nr:hypothetical protein [Hormoscilla sp. GM7CHS1pb]